MRVSIFLALIAVSATAQDTRWRTLDGKAPIVIGHRGASGYLPEHTLESYQRAARLGADFVEPDLVMTKDGHLIARHEPLLDGTTDVATRPEYADRKTTKILDGVKTVGFYASDFTLYEIKRLRAIQPRGDRSAEFNGRYEIPTLEEIIESARREGFLRGRPVGIYPETKHPTFHFALGLPLEDKLVEVLDRYQLNRPDSPVIIQSFEPASLQYLRKKTAVRLVQLIDADDVANSGALTFAAPYDKPFNFAVSGDPRGFADMVTPKNLAEIARYADGIGPWKRFIVSVFSQDANLDGKADDVNGDGKVDESDRVALPPTNLITQAHAAGLFVHAYTFRNEKSTLALTYAGKPENEYIQFFMLGVDGVFSDFSDTAVEGRRLAETMVRTGQ